MMESRQDHPSEKDERYLRILQALGKGPRTSFEICKETGFDDPFRCSSALAVLIRRGAVIHGYALTELGKKRLIESRPVQEEPQIPKLPERTVPEPSMPSLRLLPPGFEWMWSGKEWVKRRKPEFRLKGDSIDLFG